MSDGLNSDLLFVAVDGWSKLIHGLVLTYV